MKCKYCGDIITFNFKTQKWHHADDNTYGEELCESKHLDREIQLALEQQDKLINTLKEMGII